MDPPTNIQLLSVFPQFNTCKIVILFRESSTYLEKRYLLLVLIICTLAVANNRSAIVALISHFLLEVPRSSLSILEREKYFIVPILISGGTDVSAAILGGF